jgi:PAS domain S-box-containing protein
VSDSLIDLGGLQVGAEDFLVAVLETTGQPIWVVGPDGLIRFANPAAIAALGYDSADELVGRRSHETIHRSRPDGSWHPAADCPALLPRETGEPVTCDLDWFVRRDGSMVAVSYVSAPLQMPRGRGVVVAFTGVEDRLRARELPDRQRALVDEQAALRRVATLVASGAPPAEVFDAVVGEIGRLLGVGSAALVRYDGPDHAVLLAGWGRLWDAAPLGARLALGGDNVVTRVARTGESVRIDYVADGASGAIAAQARTVDTRAAVGVPVFMEGRLWGAMVAAALGDEAMPDETELRLEQFTTLLATAIANSDAHLELARLANEQAALRRVATLVAEETPPDDLFARVAEEAVDVMPGDVEAGIHRYDVDGCATVVATVGSPPPHGIWLGERIPLAGTSVIARVFREGRPVREDFYAASEGAIAERAQRHGIRTAFGSPIRVRGRLWGAMIVANHDVDPFPADIERQVRPFTDLVATSIANAQAREERGRLADEQAALRRVATLVAEGVSSSELFGAVTEEVGRLLDADLAGMIRYVDDDTITPVAAWAAEGEHPAVEGLWPLEGDVIATAILRTRGSTREDDWGQVGGAIADFVLNTLGVTSSVGSPIVVEGRVWGALFVHSKRPHQPLAEDTESRLTNFAELVATAMSNAQARTEVERLAEEQAALRRVATLVASGPSPTEVFGAVAVEVAKSLASGAVGMLRFEPEGTATLVAQSDAPWDPPPLGTRFALDGENVVATVSRTRKAVRLDDWANATGAVAQMARVLGIRSSVATPIVVEGQLWGTMIAVSDETEPLPADTESRLGQFTELVATAIANAEARAQVSRLVEEQAALRRVATLVARGVGPADVFEAIAREAGRLLDADAMHMGRYDAGAAISVAGWSREGDALPVGTRVELDGANVASLVHQSGRPERIDGYSAPAGGTADRLRDGMRVYSSVAVPIIVDGRLWGLMIASSKDDQPLLADTEPRLKGFTDLAEMAISNAEARTALAASSARLVAAADEERRRVVRDLHDGAQQRLVHTIITIKLTRGALEKGDDARATLAEALEQAERANAELRELAHGILPAVLSHGGLRAGLEALASRTPVPVEIGADVGRLPATVEATAYFIVAEALTNVAKHARADRAEVTAGVGNGALRIRVRDDGVGGARPDGSGLVGLADRIAALGGRFQIESPAGEGTLVAADIPVPDESRTLP